MKFPNSNYISSTEINTHSVVTLRQYDVLIQAILNLIFLILHFFFSEKLLKIRFK
jgi:hypothetical protein